MRTSFQLVSGGVGQAVSLADLKLHLNITDTNSDTRLGEYLFAATEWLEQATARAFLGVNGGYTAPTFCEKFNVFPREGLRPVSFETCRSPVTSVTSLTYYDTTNTQQTLVSGTDYYVSLSYNLPALITPNWINGDWPSEYLFRPDCVALTYTACWTPLPYQAAHAIKILCSYWNESRGEPSTDNLPAGLEHLVEPLRMRQYG